MFVIYCWLTIVFLYGRHGRQYNTYSCGLFQYSCKSSKHLLSKGWSRPRKIIGLGRCLSLVGRRFHCKQCSELAGKEVLGDSAV